MTAVKSLRFPLCTHRFALSGLNLERFMNTAKKAGIPLLSVKRRDQRTLVCECYSADLPGLNRLAQEKGWRLQDTRPLGLSALLGALRRRPGIPIGLALAVALAIGLSQFVWRVEVHGAGAYQAEIASYLAEAGCKPGVPRARLDAQALESALTRRYPAIAWFHVYVYNITLVVDVTQGVPMPELPSAEPGDVVAQRGGIVDSVRVYAGTAAVKPGDVVRKGQVLIRGVERAADEQYAAVHARGVVMARCWQSNTVRMPLRDVKSAETGRETSQTQLCTPWYSLPRQLDSPDFLAYNTYVSTTPLVGCFFPVFVKNVVRREVSLEYVARSQDEVRREAADAAMLKLKTALYGYEIIDKWVDYCMIEGDTLAATATAEWLMDIGGDSPP